MPDYCNHMADYCLWEMNKFNRHHFLFIILKEYALIYYFRAYGKF